jgi:hypothetical protein
MPQTLEIDIEWTERYAWWPVRSSWSKKLIWFKKYHQGEIYYDAMGRPPIKESSWKLIYSANEYLMYQIRNSEGSGSRKFEPLPYGYPSNGAGY